MRFNDLVMGPNWLGKLLGEKPKKPWPFQKKLAEI
jgi:hypothetical protein